MMLNRNLYTSINTTAQLRDGQVRISQAGVSGAVMLNLCVFDRIHAALHADDEPQAEQPVERETCGGCRYGGHFYEDNFEDTYGTCFVDGDKETEVHINRPACRHYRPRKES